ncbi:MFS transporter [Ramlibacter sp.]|uniref:MFS transporter n=1 Tax=Ramlibacter sp. TaxID=1917967 RepID=UPI003D0AD2A7
MPPARSLLSLAILYAGSSAMLRICDPMLLQLSRDFDVTMGRAALTVYTFAIAFGLLQLVFGPLGDRWGKRRVIGVCGLGCVIGNLLALVAWSLDALVVARVVAGITAAGMGPLMLAWLGDTVPYEHRQTVLARFMASSLTGVILGQWVSGVMTDWFGWRSVFAMLAVLFCVGGLAVLCDPAVRRERGSPSQSGYFQGMGRVLSLPWPRWIIGFTVAEGTFTFAAMVFLPTFLVREYGLGLSTASGVAALYGIGGFAYSFLARRLVPRYGETGMAWRAGIAMAVSWMSIALVGHWALVVPAVLVAGLGFYSLHGVLQTHATQMVPELRGTAVGLFASAMFAGIALGVVAASQVVDSGGFRPVFAVCAVALGVLGYAVSVQVGRRGA